MATQKAPMTASRPVVLLGGSEFVLEAGSQIMLQWDEPLRMLRLGHMHSATIRAPFSIAFAGRQRASFG